MAALATTPLATQGTCIGIKAGLALANMHGDAVGGSLEFSNGFLFDRGPTARVGLGVQPSAWSPALASCAAGRSSSASCQMVRTS